MKSRCIFMGKVSNMKVAIIQLGATVDKARNLKKAVDFTRRAIDRCARLIALPEVFIFRGRIRSGADVRAVAETIPGTSLKPLMALAQKHKVFILAGSIYEKAGGTNKAYNTSVLIDSHGTVIAKYRKIHLFEAVLGNNRIREADCFWAGYKTVTALVEKFKIGLSICYDLRFPEMYRKYAALGVHAICVPSAFTYETGRAHWEVLVRARAIDNRCYLLAPNQVGKSDGNVRHYGHSMIVGPWGEILAVASGHREEVIYGQLNLKDIKTARQKLPALMSNKR